MNIFKPLLGRVLGAVIAVVVCSAVTGGCASVSSTRAIISNIPTYELAQSVTQSQPPPEPLVFMLPGEIPLNMVGIGEGSFIMGTPMPESGNLNRNLRGNDAIGHKVTLINPYWIGKYEVTCEQYESIMGDGSIANVGSNFPADGVTYEDARAFTQKLNDLFEGEIPDGYYFDLPTEAQWEYACRAGTVTTYNNGTMGELDSPQVAGNLIIECFKEESRNLDEVGWYKWNSGGHAHEVGQKRPNNWGLYDMHGNVVEWCRDYYDYIYGNPTLPKEIDPAISTPTYLYNYIEPFVFSCDNVYVINKWDKGLRVVKGGSFKLDPKYCTSYSRMRWQIGAGFRVALVKYTLPELDVKDETIYGIHPAMNERSKNLKAHMERLRAIDRDRIALSIIKLGRASTDVAIQTYFARKAAKQSGGNGGGMTGFATIKGPDTLSYDFTHKNGQTGYYRLYVGGKDVTSETSWSTAGTSISINSSGCAIARDPPVGRGGTFKTGIRAKYNGNYYTKSITIRKR